jgi:ubiquinone/menaquinone biosynthesis C-methylase UbiE
VPEDGPSRRFFDLWSRVYDNPVVQAATYRPVQDAVVRAVREQAPGRVLDVGCGTGQLTVRIAEELGADAIGCDYSRGMLEQARARSAPGDTARSAPGDTARSAPGDTARSTLPWVQGDATCLPIASSSVDAVVCTESFHWYPDQPAALAELARVLVPGGRLYIALVNPPSLLVSRATARWSRRAGQPFRWPTPLEMRVMVESAGLRVLRQRPVLRLPTGPLLPPVLTVAERGAGAERSVAPAGGRA